MNADCWMKRIHRARSSFPLFLELTTLKTTSEKPSTVIVAEAKQSETDSSSVTDTELTGSQPDPQTLDERPQLLGRRPDEFVNGVELPVDVLPGNRCQHPLDPGSCKNKFER